MNRRAFLATAAAAPVLGLPSIATAQPRISDPVFDLVSEWDAIDADINASSEDIAADDPRVDRHKAIERRIMSGERPLTLAGVMAALAFARREVDACIMVNGGPRSAAEVYEEDPGSGLVLALIDAVTVALAEASL